MLSAMSTGVTFVRAEEYSDLRTYEAPDVLRHFATADYGGIEVEDRLGEVTEPTLVLCGRHVRTCVVAAGEAFNEIMDRLNYGSWRWDDTLVDVANTMFWPTVICLGVRLRPIIARRG